MKSLWGPAYFEVPSESDAERGSKDTLARFSRPEDEPGSGNPTKLFFFSSGTSGLDGTTPKSLLLSKTADARLPDLALRVISRARNHQVAFGEKRTSDAGKRRLGQPQMTLSGHCPRTNLNTYGSTEMYREYLRSGAYHQQGSEPMHQSGGNHATLRVQRHTRLRRPAGFCDRCACRAVIRTLPFTMTIAFHYH